MQALNAQLLSILTTVALVGIILVAWPLYGLIKKHTEAGKGLNAVVETALILVALALVVITLRDIAGPNVLGNKILPFLISLIP